MRSGKFCFFFASVFALGAVHNSRNALGVERSIALRTIRKVLDFNTKNVMDTKEGGGVKNVKFSVTIAFKDSVILNIFESIEFMI